MTFDSIKKSYKTFIRLLWVSEKEESEKYAYGLYAFVYAITDYANVKGYSELFCDTSITGLFNRIETDTLSNSSLRTKALLKTIDKFHIVLDSIQSNKEVFDYLFKILIHKPDGIKYYDIFYPRNSKSAYLFFIENKSIQEPMYTEYFYSYLKNCPDFNMDNFMKVMVEQIPTYNGFNAADNYMSSLILHINELKIKTVEDILEIYKSNYQCTGRARAMITTTILLISASNPLMLTRNQLFKYETEQWLTVQIYVFSALHAEVAVPIKHFDTQKEQERIQ